MFKPIVFANTIQSMSIILHAVERMGIAFLFRISIWIKINRIVPKESCESLAYF